jgi:hypothetical protein
MIYRKGELSPASIDRAGHRRDYMLPERSEVGVMDLGGWYGRPGMIHRDEDRLRYVGRGGISLRKRSLGESAP